MNRLRSASAHAHTLDRLEVFSFSLNTGSNDDFGFLELPNIFGTDIAHAGRNRTHQILGTVIDSGRTE